MPHLGKSGMSLDEGRREKIVFAPLKFPQGGVGKSVTAHILCTTRYSARCDKPF